MPRHAGLSVVVGLLLLLNAGPGVAQGSVEAEIAHLLTFIADSQCVFVRNGDEHNAADARDHISMKYSHLRKRIKSAEDFIKYTATKSSLSGKLYLVRCDGVETPTGEWLREELRRMRGEAT